MKVLLIILTFLFSGAMLSAQQPAYFTIGEDELKDHHIYTLHQGDDEIIYAGTNKGLFAYKHGTFEKIEGAPEQIRTAVFDLKRDNNGDLYCMNFSGQIFQLVNNRLVLFYQAPPEHLSSFFNFYFDTNNDVVIASNSLFKVFRKTKKIKIYLLGTLKDIRSFKQISQNHFFFSSMYMDDRISFELKNDSIVKLSLLDHNNNQLHNDTLHPFRPINTTAPFPTKKDTKSNIPITTYIYNDRIDINGYTHGLHYSRVYQFNDHEFFLASREKGVRRYQKENNTIKNKELWFPKQFISFIYQTKDGKILFSTFGKGIHIIPNRNIIREDIIPSDEICNGISNRNGLLYFTTNSNKIYSFNDKIVTLKKQYSSSNVVQKIFHVEDSNFFEKDGLKHFIYNDAPNNRKAYYSSLKDVWELPNKNILIAHRMGLSLYSNKEINNPNWTNVDVPNFYAFKPLKGRFEAVCYSPLSKTIYVSHKGQLLAIDSTYTIKNITYQNQDVSCRNLYFKDGTLYIATQKHGILTLENKKLIQKYSTKNGLGHNYINKIEIVDNLLFLSHIEGFQIINIDNNKIKTIGTAEGISKGGISDFDTDGKRLWILRRNEILSLYVDQLKPSDYNITLHFDSLTINEERIDIQKESIFNHQQRKFNFHLDFRSAILQSETKISYWLEGEDKNWITPNTKDYSISYKALPPGDYTFRAYAQYRNKKSDEFIYSFRIKYPFWQRLWFYILVLSFISGIFYLFYKTRINQINQINQAERKKQIAEKEMIESELKALRSQMNPHFIFNSLNSIQDLILREETDKSYDYIVLFADLVRSTLNHSNKQFIPIDKELEFLNVYLSLEKLRFKEGFNYTINYSNIEGIEIPSMLIQPFIENALLHGLLHKKGEKELNIYFEVIENILLCTVTDNGVGRERAMQIRKRQKRQHQSFSMEAIKKRLSFFSGQHDIDAKYEFVDLISEGKAMGTKVIIQMPYKHLF